MLFETDLITKLPGVGPALSLKLKKLNIKTVKDLLLHVPFRYVDFRSIVNIADANLGQTLTISGKLIKVEARRSFKSRLSFTEAIIEDETGIIKSIWFNQSYLAKQLKEGQDILLAGQIEQRGQQKQLTNPLFESPDSDPIYTGKLLPIYHLSSGVSNLQLTKLVNAALQTIEFDKELLDDSVIKNFSLPSTKEAILYFHNPKELDNLGTYHERLAINEILPEQLALKLQKLNNNQKSYQIPFSQTLVKGFLSKLSFDLTASQKKSAWEILQDLEKNSAMNRMLIGDVGSGKTIVAAIGALSTTAAKKQVLILVPTEILAKQHYQTFWKLFANYQLNIGCLTRSISSINQKDFDKDTLINAITDKELDIIIGTHALLKDSIKKHEFGLIIVDEQHRFGVMQRNFLLQDMSGKKHTPHYLSLSATPIPRSLALSLYGNIELSVIDQLPEGKLPITTQVLDQSSYGVAYNKIKQEIKSGKQAFVVLAKVEESESDTKDVKTEFEKIKKLFPKNKVGVIYGSLPPEQKNSIMQDFAEHNYDILVASTVIEVGIDIPNATVMIIEGAERFGLAQLHQLRGRIGRSNLPSYCYVFVSPNQTEELPRLQKFASTQNGFVLAEFDLKTRGFGDLLGLNQSGHKFRFSSYFTISALEKSQKIAEYIITNDNSLKNHTQLKIITEKLVKELRTE